MTFQVTMKDKIYDVVIERNSLDNIEHYVDLNNKTLVITDDGIPFAYVQKYYQSVVMDFFTLLNKARLVKTLLTMKKY